MTTILNLLSFLNMNGFLTHARVAYIDPVTNELMPSPSNQPRGQESNDVLIEVVPEKNLQDSPPSTGQSEDMTLDDVLMEPAQQLKPEHSNNPLPLNPNADPAVGISVEQANLPTPTGGVPIYETPIFIGAVIFCILLAGLFVYLKKRK